MGGRENEGRDGREAGPCSRVSKSSLFLLIPAQPAKEGKQHLFNAYCVHVSKLATFGGPAVCPGLAQF